MLVIKVGGGEGNAVEPLLDELSHLWEQGERWILVHGGSARTNKISEQLGHPPEFITSPSGFTSRRTDKRTAKILAMVYTGEVNTSIVRELQQRGVNAVGLSGIDGGLFSGPRKKALIAQENGHRKVIRDDYTGKVSRVNVHLLETLLNAGFAPVISPPAISDEHDIINVDGDRASAALAGAIQAESLILLTGASGVLTDVNDMDSVISSIPEDKIGQVIEVFAEGRMRIKLLAAREALQSGVQRVYISASDVEQPVIHALNGGGTVIENVVSVDGVV